MSRPDPITVVDYDPEWPTAFERLKARLLSALVDLPVIVEHVGSTAVPGLAAKPVIDLDVVVASEDEVRLAIERLAVIGYQHEGDLGVTGREAFRWPNGEPRHHVYVCVTGAEALRRHLAFRDFLRSHPGEAARFGEVKKRAADKHPDDRLAYAQAKDDVAAWIMAAALDEAASS